MPFPTGAIVRYAGVDLTDDPMVTYAVLHFRQNRLSDAGPMAGQRFREDG